MTPEAKSLTQVLLDHHRNVCLPANHPHDPDPYTIPYKTLCERAGVPWLTQSVGHFLQETAEWCDAKSWPPINSLAVNADTRRPGEGYDNAPNCSLETWLDQVMECIDFRGYPTTVI